jgi:hypothetical protein
VPSYGIDIRSTAGIQAGGDMRRVV